MFATVKIDWLYGLRGVAETLLLGGRRWYHVSDPSLNNKQPIIAATGRTGDISAMLSFHWLEPIYYKVEDTSFAPKNMYGFRVSSTYKEALEIDESNGDTKWADATALEMQQLKDYSTFINKGTYAVHKIPRGFQQIKIHLVNHTCQE